MSSTEDYLDRLLRSVTEGVPMDALQEEEKEEGLVEDALLDDKVIIEDGEADNINDTSLEMPDETSIEDITFPEFKAHPDAIPEEESAEYISDVVMPEFTMPESMTFDSPMPEETPQMDMGGMKGFPSFAELSNMEDLTSVEDISELENIGNIEGLSNHVYSEELPAEDSVEEAPAEEMNLENYEMPEEMSEEISEEMPEELPIEDSTEEAPAEDMNLENYEMPEEMSEEIPEEMPEELPIEDSTEEAPAEEMNLENYEMPEEMPEEMSEEMPEELPVEDSTEEAPNEDMNLEGFDMPLEDMPLEDMPLEDMPLEDMPLEDMPLDDMPLEDMPLEDIPLDDLTLDDVPVDDIPLEELSQEETSTENTEMPNMDSDDLMSDAMLNDMLSELTATEGDSSDAQGEESMQDEDIANLLKSIEEMENTSFSETVGADEPDTDYSAAPNADNNSDDDMDAFDDTISAFGEDDSLNDVLESMKDIEGISEISDLLDMDENNELIEPDAEDASGEDSNAEGAPSSGGGMGGSGGSLDDTTDDEEGKGKKKKKEKKKKEKGEKKPGLIARIIKALFEEVEDEDTQRQIFEETATDIAGEGDVDNQKILKEMGSDDKGKKKKEKKKKEKPKKEKPKKEPKPKKPKKEKKVKEKPVDPEPYVKLPKKKVIPICIFCLTIGIALITVSFFYPYYLDVKKAESGFDHENYKEAFLALYGHNLNEEEEALYEKTVVVFRVQRKYESYNNYMNMNRPLEALNALVQGVKVSDELYNDAYEHGVVAQFEKYRGLIIEALSNTFSVTESQAREWAAIRDSEEYTRALKAHLDMPETSEADYKEENDVILSEEAEFYEQQPEETIEINDIDDLDALDALDDLLYEGEDAEMENSDDQGQEENT